MCYEYSKVGFLIVYVIYTVFEAFKKKLPLTALCFTPS